MAGERSPASRSGGRILPPRLFLQNFKINTGNLRKTLYFQAFAGIA